MIPCVEKLMLNKYAACSLPSNRDLYSRYGERSSNSVSSDSTAVFNKTKLDGYAEAQKIVDKYIYDELEAYEAQQAELDRLRLESEELKTLKDSDVR